MMDANLRKIRTKDLHSLEPLHDAIYDNDGRVVGIHGSIAEEELDPLIGNFNLNFVGRSLLDGGHHRQQGTVKYSKRLPRLVRYVDMLDPEYYESYASLGRSKHFGEHYDINGDDEAEGSKNGKDANHTGRYSNCLAERTSLVVVPIPFSSDWFSQGGQLRGNSSNSVGLPSPQY